MISRFEDLNRLFDEIDKLLGEDVSFYVIGGAMMLYYGVKDSTKDIDIVVDKENEFLIVQRTLNKIGFIKKVPSIEYRRVDLSQIFIRGDFRIDLFNKIVCKGFQLSYSMKNGAKKIIQLKHLSVFICSNEDVFLFKTFTEREGDISDCIAIAQKTSLDWAAILKELKYQISLSGNKIWITWVGERFDILEERGLEIPVIKDINKLREKFYKEYEKSRHKI